LKGRDHVEYLGVDGKIILEWILGKYGGRVWTGCRSQDRGQLRALVNMVMNLSVPQKERNFLTISFSRGTLPHGVSLRWHPEEKKDLVNP
jgi:hypothetical protein